MSERLVGRYVSEDFGELTLVAPNDLDWTIPIWEAADSARRHAGGFFLWLRIALPDGFDCDGWLELQDSQMRGAFTNGRLTSKSTGVPHPDLPLQSNIFPRLNIENQRQMLFGGLDLSIVSESMLKGLIVIVRRGAKASMRLPDRYWRGGVAQPVVWRLVDAPAVNG